MSLIFRWIQLSDIHFQTQNSAFNTKQLRDKLPAFLETIDKPFDAMIISGDFRFAPEGEDNPQKVIDYIKQIAKILEIEDVSTQVVTVPGNHDLSRGAVRSALMEKAQKEYDPEIGTIDTEILISLMNDFKFYNELHSKLGDASVCNNQNPHWVVEFEKCNVLVLNTALTAGCDEDSGRLIVGSSYVESIISGIDNKKPTIAVGHHALEELNVKENRTITHLLEQSNIKLYLCGHTHDSWSKAFAETGREINTGCLMQDDKSVIASFIVGELHENGTVKINSFKWDFAQKNWFSDLPNTKEYTSLYPVEIITLGDQPIKHKVEKIYNPFSIAGYTLLGSLGSDGIKYYWKKGDNFVESIAFNKRIRNSANMNDNLTSAYTISTSFGCQLSTTNQQCRFCETGASNFKGLLKADDIALQCIFMAEYDSNCASYPHVRNNKREFSFMGQGEPGFNYPAIKQAILYNDYVMNKLEQNVSRYIISTCGVTDFIPALLDDIKNGIYQNKVTLHFSLHEIDKERNELMPINQNHDYKEVIEYCKALYRVTGEKIGVGILMFDKFQLADGKKYTLTLEKLGKMLDTLDNDVFRIDLCAVNRTSMGQQKHQLSYESANKLLDLVLKRGFEGKIFISFADNQSSGCGMLSSDIALMNEAGSTTIDHFNRAIELLNESKKMYFDSLNSSN